MNPIAGDTKRAGARARRATRHNDARLEPKFEQARAKADRHPKHLSERLTAKAALPTRASNRLFNSKSKSWL